MIKGQIRSTDLYRFEHRGMHGVINRRNGRWVLARAGKVSPDFPTLAGIQEGLIEELGLERAPRLFNVKITDGCNLRCSYCYAQPASPAEATHMSRGMIDQLFGWIAAVTSADDEKMFVFHGGEPLLNFGVVEYCVRKYDTPKMDWLLQTNGTQLTSEHIAFLKSYDIRVSVSIDGPEEIHNKQRGWFGTVMTAFRRLREAGVRCSAITTVTIDGVKEINQIVDFFVSEGIHHLVINPIVPIGRATPTMHFEEHERASYLRHLWNSALSHHVGGTLVDVSDLTTAIAYLFTNARDYMCRNAVCGAGNLMVSVDVKGDVYPCDYFAGEASFCCGSILRPADVNLVQPSSGVAQRGECHKCPFLAICNGVEPCPAIRYYLRQNGHVVDVASWKTCEIARFYKDVMYEATTNPEATALVEAILDRRYGAPSPRRDSR